MHFWYDVGNPGTTFSDGVTVTLDRPVYQAPTYDDVLNNVDWTATMRKGDRRETVLGSGRNLPSFSYLVRGCARNTSKGAFVFGNDMISANSKQYKIIDFNVVHHTGGSYLEFRVEGGRLGNDATVNIDGRDYPVVDAAWSPVYGTHTWPTRYTLNRPLSSAQRFVRITSD
ncbi:hypothetical protein [Candidatus Poriferisodalis sp.]|uniref:hypothetical protein n=1 Tax=Candidatus Poriferisodalis sp. TaxID=3101277 RepID=UPI003B0272EB